MGTKDRKEREKAQKRERIIRVAEKIFFKKGFENTTMDEIAEKAEFSKGTLYLYFKNKEALYSAIALRSMDIMMDILNKEITKSNNPKEKLESIKTAYLQSYIKHPEHMKVILFAFRYIPLIEKKDTDELMLQIQEKQAIFMGTITSIIKEARENGTLDIPEDEVSLEELFYGGGLILEGIFMRAVELEPFLEKIYGVKPEQFIRAAYKLLRF